MITVYSAMLVTLGFLLAALLLLFILPVYRRRIERFTSEKLKRALPLTEAEIRADKDRLRAEFAIDLHTLEMKLEDASLTAARQSVEINRRDAKIHDLDRAVDSQKAAVEEHENARRVLEHAITDRLPKIEQRLGDARKLLLQRDREIAVLTETSGKQTEALEQATQINLQLTEDANRLTTALETRAARNRDTPSDARFDGEVALRTELEALRAQTREQAQLLERLQVAEADDSTARADIERMKHDLSEAETQLLAFRSEVGAEMSARDTLTARIRELEQIERDRSSETASLKAALASYEEAARETSGALESSAAAKAELSALQAEIIEQSRTIQTLRAEVTSNNERLTRQAQHFRDEMRRLSTANRAGGEDRNGEAPRQTLAERIAQPRVPAPDVHGAARDVRPAAYLAAVGSGADTGEAPAANGDGAASERPAERPAAATEAPRRGRLLERISSLDKQ